MPPRWGYRNVALMELPECRPAGATGMLPHWGYFFNDAGYFLCFGDKIFMN